MPAPTSFDGYSIGGSTQYDCALYPAGKGSAFSEQIQFRARTNQPPVADYRSQPEHRIPFEVLYKSGSESLAQWEQSVRKIFKPSGGARTLLATLDDGTAVQMTVDVAELDLVSVAVFSGEFVSAELAWRSTTTNTDSATPLLVASGNIFSLPSITLTPNTSTVKRLRRTITDTLGNGLSTQIIKVTFDSTGQGATANSNYEVFFKKISIPFYVRNLNNAATDIFFRVDVPPGGTASVDIYYGSSVNNTVTNNQLDKAGLDLDSASFTNSNAVWDSATVFTNVLTAPAVPLAWRPAKLGAQQSGAHYQVAVSGTSAVITVSDSAVPQNDDYDALVLVVGTKADVTSALAGLSRVVALPVGTGISTLTFKIRYRKHGDVAWRTAGSDRVSVGTDTGAVDLDDAEVIALILEATGTGAFTVTATLSVSGTFQLATAGSPTLSSDAAVTARYVNSTLANSTTGETIQLSGVYLDDVALTIDTLAKTITPASGPVNFQPSGGISFSNPDQWMQLALGTNAWSNPANASASFSWANRFLE